MEVDVVFEIISTAASGLNDDCDVGIKDRTPTKLMDTANRTTPIFNIPLNQAQIVISFSNISVETIILILILVKLARIFCS